MTEVEGGNYDFFTVTLCEMLIRCYKFNKNFLISSPFTDAIIAGSIGVVLLLLKYWWHLLQWHK